MTQDIAGETLALGLDGGFSAPRVELFRRPDELAAALPRAVCPRDLECSPARPVVLVAGGPSLCLAAVVTGAERRGREVLVRHRLVHRTRLPGEAAEGWLDTFFAGSSLRLEAPYHLVRLHGVEPDEPIRFLREYEVSIRGRLARVGRDLHVVSDKDPFEGLSGTLGDFEPRATLAVKIGPFCGAVPSAWRHDPARPGLPLALEVPELARRPLSFLLAPDAAAALREHAGRRVRAAGVVGGRGRELRPAFVCAEPAGELLFEDPEAGWGRRLTSSLLAAA